LQLKDSVYKLRRARFPLLANFLLTSDIIPESSSDEDSSPLPLPLSQPPRTHPPPLYYLPAILTPAQESFINRRKTQVVEAAEQEYSAFLDERSKGVEDILELRRRVAEEDERKKDERQEKEKDAMDADLASMPADKDKTDVPEVEMDVDAEGAVESKESKESENAPMETEKDQEEKKDEMQADDEDAVEY